MTPQGLVRAPGLDVTYRLKEAPTVMTPDHRLFSLRARRQDGFTLIELLVVIVILGVLAAIVVFSVKGIGDKGRKNAVAADAATLRTAEEAFCAKHGHYGTVDDLKAAGLLGDDPGYNMVTVGEENKCGRGEKSSYTLYDTSPMEPAGDDIKVGPAPSDLAVDEKADRVYVVSKGDNTVTVIDGKTDKPIGSPIDVSGAVKSPTRIAVNSGTGQVYVGGATGVAIIDTANANQVTYVRDFTTLVSALAVSPENGDVYVAGGSASNSRVAYIAAGASSATMIPLPAGAGIVSVNNGTDFSFDPARHAVYFAKFGTGSSANPDIGLFAISSQTHTVRFVKDFPTAPSCQNNSGKFLGGSTRGMTAVDPNRNLVYLLAKKCVEGGASIATIIAINPENLDSTVIDDLPESKFTHISAVYNPAAGATYVYSGGVSVEVAGCGRTSGRISEVVGTAVKREVPACANASATGNIAHKIAVLKNFNRIFVAHPYGIDPVTGALVEPGGIGVSDGTLMLRQSPLGRLREFVSLAVNNTTAKLYALDSAKEKVTVFRTGSV